MVTFRYKGKWTSTPPPKSGIRIIKRKGRTVRTSAVPGRLKSGTGKKPSIQRPPEPKPKQTEFKIPIPKPKQTEFKIPMPKPKQPAFKIPMPKPKYTYLQRDMNIPNSKFKEIPEPKNTIWTKGTKTVSQQTKKSSPFTEFKRTGSIYTAKMNPGSTTYKKDMSKPNSVFEKVSETPTTIGKFKHTQNVYSANLKPKYTYLQKDMSVPNSQFKEIPEPKDTSNWIKANVKPPAKKPSIQKPVKLGMVRRTRVVRQPTYAVLGQSVPTTQPMKQQPIAVYAQSIIEPSKTQIQPDYDKLVVESAARRQKAEIRIKPRIDTKPIPLFDPYKTKEEERRITKESNMLLIQRKAQKQQTFKETANLAGRMERQGHRDYIIGQVQKGKITITTAEDAKKYNKIISDWTSEEKQKQQVQADFQAKQYKMKLLDVEIKRIEQQKAENIKQVQERDYYVYDERRAREIQSDPSKSHWERRAAGLTRMTIPIQKLFRGSMYGLAPVYAVKASKRAKRK